MLNLRSRLRRLWKRYRNVHRVLLRADGRAYLCPAWWPEWRIAEAAAVVRLIHRRRRKPRRPPPAGVIVWLAEDAD